MPERTEATQVAARRVEPLEEPRQHRLAGDARDAQQLRHERIAAQMGEVREFARVTKQAVHEGQGLFQRQEFVVGQRRRVRQGGRQLFAPIHWSQPAPEQGTARVWGKVLIGEA
jgi:small-conductance mechanosensitive channel